MAAIVNVSEQMLDIVRPEQEVEVSVRPDAEGYSLWVNVDGVCRLRVTRIPKSVLRMDLKGKITGVGR